MLRSVLVALDLSPQSDRVAGRAARLPLDAGARLTLVHVVPRGLRPPARRRAERDARDAMAAEAETLAAALRGRATVRPVVTCGVPAAEIADRAAAAKADLVVVGAGGPRAVRDALLGSTAERIVRQGRRPTLVVRLPPRAPYRRPAVALDLDGTADDVLAFVLRLVPPPRPRTAVIHAYAAPFEQVVYPSLATDEVEEYRERARRDAVRALAERLDAAVARARIPSREAPSWRTYLRHGDPRTVVPKAVAKVRADLLVLGTHGWTGVAYAFLGSVAGEILREVACDVAVVPPRRNAGRAR